MSEPGISYSAYSNSALEWLPKIPQCWSVVRNGQIFSQRNETGFPELPILEVSLKTGVRVRDLDGSGRKQIMKVRSDYKPGREGRHRLQHDANVAGSRWGGAGRWPS